MIRLLWILLSSVFCHSPFCLADISLHARSPQDSSSSAAQNGVYSGRTSLAHQSDKRQRSSINNPPCKAGLAVSFFFFFFLVYMRAHNYGDKSFDKKKIWIVFSVLNFSPWKYTKTSFPLSPSPQQSPADKQILGTRKPFFSTLAHLAAKHYFYCWHHEQTQNKQETRRIQKMAALCS